MKTLYVINSPCWTENAPSGLNNSFMFGEPVSENFTYFYYNLLKFGLVKSVKIFVEEKRWRIDRNFIQKKIDTDYGSLELLQDKNKFEIINTDPEKNYVFCWSNIDDCKNIKNKFVIVDNQFNGYIQKSDVNKNFHDLVLTESENFKKYIKEDIPILVYKLISSDHEKFIKKNNNINFKKTYDWIIVSSFDKRKRHLDFLNLLQNNNLSNLKGCIVARDPDNKKQKVLDFFKKKTPWKILKKVRKLKKEMNFDIFINISQNKKIDLLSQSKVFVNPSSLDSGPRAQVEAAQLKIPILTMAHIGAADIVEPGKNGEIANNLNELPKLLNKILDNTKKYRYNEINKNLKSEYFMPILVCNIKHYYNKKNV